MSNAKQECPYCRKAFTPGAGLTSHKRKCQYKDAGDADSTLADEVIDLMALLQNSLSRKRKPAGLRSEDGGGNG